MAVSIRPSRFSPTGTQTRGTNNNCGNGYTPWGTYLTCEENFNGYFGTTAADHKMPDDYKRYGIVAETRYGYEKFDERFDVSKNPNEPRRAGYVVEIDPSDLMSDMHCTAEYRANLIRVMAKRAVQAA